MSIFRNNPRSHVFYDAHTMDIWDRIGEFKDKHNISSSHIPFGATTRVEWQETPEEYVIIAELPAGLKKDDVKVKVRDGEVVEISGGGEVEKEEKHDNYYHFERRSGKFFRVFSLPEDSRTDHIRSSLENGILTVTVPKRDFKKSHVKNLEIKG